jgi:AcrR family transcriptional regulator
MTAVAARFGYRDASVARVVEQAGVSRATFYVHFADKEACFVAAFQRAAERIEVVLARIDAEVPPAGRAADLLDYLLDNISRGPAAARILLVEALAGGPEARRARQRLMSSVEAHLERWLSVPGNDGQQLAISGRAIMEGAGNILAMRVSRGETALLAEQRDDLLAWIDSYCAPKEHHRLSPAEWRDLGGALVGAIEAAPPVAPEPSRLPRGKGAIAPGAVSAEYRERILAAVAQLVQSEGYTAMTVADIVKTGAVTREAFYELFRSKEEAFLAAQIAALESSIAVTAAAFFPGDSWPNRVWEGLEALFGYVAVHPALVYLDVIESYAAGEAAVRRSFDNRMAYSLFLEDGYRQTPEAERLPRLCSEAIGGAILGVLRWQVNESRTELTLEALPQVVYVALAPFIGADAAIDLVAAKVRDAVDARRPA